jgi:hypothetical protein
MVLFGLYPGLFIESNAMMKMPRNVDFTRFSKEKRDLIFIRSLSGDTRNRTGDKGFADQLLTALKAA